MISLSIIMLLFNKKRVNYYTLITYSLSKATIVKV